MTAWYRRPGFWNLPNVLTLLRIAAVPLMWWLLIDAPTRVEAMVACGVFVGAMLTDILDGLLARRWGLVSMTGAFLDPLADKLMVVTTMVMLTSIGWLPAWITVVIVCRELTVTAMRTVAIANGLAIPADAFGKLKTALQATALGYLLWHYPTVVWLWPSTELDVASSGMVLMWGAVAMTVISLVNYLRVFFRHAKTLTS